jgi:hypothetical protein
MSEEVINESTEVLSDKLSFKLPNTASYINNRRSVNLPCVGSNIYQGGGSGTKLLRFQLNSDHWADLDTIRVNFRLVNKAPIVSTNDPILRPLGGAHLFFRRLRILCGGAVIEDILQYGRTHQMFECLMNGQVRDNLEIENFGTRFDNSYTYNNYTTGTCPGINGSGTNRNAKYVSFKPFAGLFRCGKMLPLTYCPLVVELELCANATDPIFSIDGTVFTTNNTSVSWEIDNPFLTFDTIELDNALQNEYDRHLQNGSLRLTYDTLIVQQQNIQQGAQALNINVARAVSCLKAVYLSFFKYDPPPTSGTDTRPERVKNKTAVNKESIEFTNPMVYSPFDVNNYDYSYELSWYLMLGPKRFPERECDSIAQTFTQLKKCLNLPDHYQHSVSIDHDRYLQNEFIIGMNMEKALDSNFYFSGENTKQGQLLYINVKPANNPAMTLNLDWIYITLHAQYNMDIRATGVTILD